MSPSVEVNQAVGAGEDLEARAAKLRQVVATPSEREAAEAELQRIEQQLAKDREATGEQAARARMVGISKAHGSLSDQLEQDARRVDRALEAVREAIRRMNERWEQVELVGREQAALKDRFGIEGRALAPVAPPARRGIRIDLPLLRDREPQLPVLEADDTKLRRRRSYGEAEGTEGYAIIIAAGLPDFAPFTPRQLEILKEREREQAQERRALSAVPAIPAGLPIETGDL